MNELKITNAVIKEKKTYEMTWCYLVEEDGFEYEGCETVSASTKTAVLQLFLAWLKRRECYVKIVSYYLRVYNC